MPPKRAVRRGQLISPWGVGSMVNFPGDESLMVCGLDAWEEVYRNAPDKDFEFIIKEERLAKRLGVSQFRLPPDFREAGAGILNPQMKIPFVRFPLWHYCPRCGAMEKLSPYGSMQRCHGPSYPQMSCHSVNERRRQYLIPVRFISVCGQGHIEDFPFMEWVHRDQSVSEYCSLRMRAGRSSGHLSGIKIECSCGSSRSLGSAFNDNSLKNINKLCSGSRPWLGEFYSDASHCGHDLKVVQRGASNVYFSSVRSSIYLPKWDKTVDRRVIEVLDSKWEFLTRRRINGKLDERTFEDIAELKGVDFNKLLAAAEIRLNGEPESKPTSDDEELFRKEEYDAILAGLGGENQDFYVVKKSADEYLPVVGRFFKSIALLHKLRETRAFAGFSRLLPEDGKEPSARKKELSIRQDINWLPAMVVRGEGIFLEFNRNELNKWEQTKAARRATELIKRLNKVRSERGMSGRYLNPRMIVLHTFAHLLINQLSFECGYGSSSLRERIYCDAEHPENQMHGILIYTASGDAEGSLGGLVRQGIPGNLEPMIVSALQGAQWCSSDPVCMESTGQGPDSCNLAACHSCCLLPETSCEEGNRILDRGLVIGTLDQPDIGFFSDFESYINNPRGDKPI